MDTTRTLGYLQRHDPFRTPDWRWQLARRLLKRGQRPRHDDDQIRLILRYQRALTIGSANPPRQPAPWKDLASAHHLREHAGVITDEIEARLLAAQTFESIATNTGVIPCVLRAYEATFFNVADSLSAFDWLLLNVLQMHTWVVGKPTRAQTWKWIALAGGAVLLDMVIAEDLGRPEPAFDDRPRFAELARFFARAAVTPMTPEHSLAFVEEAAELFGEERYKSIIARETMIAAHINFLQAFGDDSQTVRSQPRTRGATLRRCLQPTSASSIDPNVLLAV